jgi:autotransporter-associated beta strand protein
VKDGLGTASLTGPKNIYAGEVKVLKGTLFVGNLTANKFTLSPGSTLAAQITDDNNYSQIFVSGPVTLTGATLSLSVLPHAYTVQSYKLIDITVPATTNKVTGTFNGLPDGATLTASTGQKFTINYNVGDGNDVVLMPIFDPLFLPLISADISPDYVTP